MLKQKSSRLFFVLSVLGLGALYVLLSYEWQVYQMSSPTDRYAYVITEKYEHVSPRGVPQYGVCRKYDRFDEVMCTPVDVRHYINASIGDRSIKPYEYVPFFTFFTHGDYPDQPNWASVLLNFTLRFMGIVAIAAATVLLVICWVQRGSERK